MVLFATVMATRVKPPYTILSRFYDQLFAPHTAVMRRVHGRILKRILPRIHSSCDLCCGSGSTAIEFARSGRKVYAVDASPDMCRATRRKRRLQGASVRVIRADMRSFALPEPVDLVTCEFDAVNHLPRKGDLERVARAVERALRPGGYFYFDVNTRRAFQEIWPQCWFVETAQCVLAAHGGYDRGRDMGWTNFDWFLPAGKLWRRFRERYEQVGWSDREIRRSLRRAGFRHVRSWDGSELIRGVDWLRPGCRIFYLARKPLGNAG